jgi:hypothetical protein
MAPRQIRTQELVKLAAEHTALSSSVANDAVRGVVDVIAELGDEVQVVDVKAEPSSEEGVVVQRTQLDPANPPALDVEAAAIGDEGMIGLSLFRSH